MIKAIEYFVFGMLATVGCKTANPSAGGGGDSASGLESSAVSSSRFNVEWSCKTRGDNSPTPAQRLLFIKDVAEKGGYLVTLFDTRDLYQNMQFFGAGTINSAGNGSVKLFDGSTIEMKSAGGMVLTSIQLEILECVKGNSSSWATAIGAQGVAFSCGGGDTRFVISKASGGYMFGKEVAKLEKQANGDLKFATATGKSMTIMKQGPGIYGGLVDLGNPSDKEALPCVGSTTLL